MDKINFNSIKDMENSILSSSQIENEINRFFATPRPYFYVCHKKIWDDFNLFIDIPECFLMYESD